MEFVLIEKESAEWNKAWDWLASHPINDGLAEPSVALNQGEAWQYTGSYMQGDKVITQFRHKAHPVVERVYVVTYEHETFDHKQISKKFKL